MNSTTDILIKSLADTITKDSVSTKSYDTEAVVRRVEDDTAWVHIPGGIDETPVKLTVDAKKGDNVQIRVGGGTAWIVGNATVPPTGDAKAIEAATKAGIAQIQAAASKAMAASAEESAQQAGQTADNAETKANYLEDDLYGDTVYQYTHCPICFGDLSRRHDGVCDICGYIGDFKTYDVLFDADSNKYYYEDSDGNEKEIEEKHLDTETDDEGNVVFVTIKRDGVTENVETISRAIETDSEDGTVTFKNADSEGSTSPTIVFEPDRLSFKKNDDEVMFISMTDEESSVTAEIIRVQTSLRIGNLEFAENDGGIVVRKWSDGDIDSDEDEEEEVDDGD